MKKKILFLCIFISSLLTLQGCWDYKEYEDMVQVAVYGIDYDVETNEVTLTIQYEPPSKEGSSVENNVVYSATGHTLFDALSKLTEGTFKDLFWGYLKIVIIGEEAAKYIAGDVIGHFNRTPAIRDNAYLAIASGKAKDAIGTPDVDSIAPSGEIIYNLINLSTDVSTVSPVTIQDFTQMLTTPGLEGVVPRVITKKPKLQDDKNESQQVSGMAVFHKDKFVGWLDEKESSGFSWITEQEVHSYEVQEKSEETDTSNILYFQVDKSTSKIKTQIDNGKPVVDIKVKVNGELRKYFSGDYSDMLLSEHINLVEKELSESIHSDIEAAVKKSQRELQSDIFGFGFAFYREHTKLWQTKLEKDWDDLYPNMEINITVDAKIQNTEKTIRPMLVK